MKVKKLFLRNYRNIERETVTFEEGVNCLYGENAQGKTNVLEAIYFYARGKSFRAFKDKELINFNSNVGYARMVYESKMARAN